MTKSKLIGLFRLFRFELSCSAGACALLAELLALGSIPSLRQAAFGFLTIFRVSATALILNDCFDIEPDRINAPSRPLPSGVVTNTEAILLATVVALLGFLSGLMIGVEAFAVVWFLALTTMFVDPGEEIAADALDVEGDRKTGSRSLAVRFGPESAMKIASVIFGMVIAGSAIPFLFCWLEWLYLPPIVIFDAVIIYSARRLLNPRIPDRINDIRRIYLTGSAIIVAFIIIRLAITVR